MDFSDLTVLCVGDVMLDRFVHGDIDRISPEAPVPVLRLRHTREMPGGAGNVAANIASLGGRAILVGLVGLDEAGARLRQLLAAQPRLAAGLVASAHRPTICKTRFIAGRQQVVRADDESAAALFADEEAGAARRLHGASAALPGGGAVGLRQGGPQPASRGGSDTWPRAACRRRRCSWTPRRTTSAATAGPPASPRTSRSSPPPGAPPPGWTTEAGIAPAARALLAELLAEAILVTRSERGMTLVERSGDVTSVPARAREVFDVSGAGDTVIAALALAHAGGRTLAQAMHIANAAAGVVVSKLGTATADIAEVMHELAAQATSRAARRSPGLQSLAATLRPGGALARAGASRGLHQRLLRHPASRPRLPAGRRAPGLRPAGGGPEHRRRRAPAEGCHPPGEHAGAARPGDGGDTLRRLRPGLRRGHAAGDDPALSPDVLVKGADYRVDQVVGAELVLAAGGRVILADLVAGQSTTSIIARAAS